MLSTQVGVDFLEQVRSDESLAQEMVKAMQAENDRASVAESASSKVLISLVQNLG